MFSFKALFIVLIISVLFPFQQSIAQSYVDNLYYTCKIWGFLKYFNSNVASGELDWDDVLLETVNHINDSTEKSKVDSLLLEMIAKAGLPAVAGDNAPTINNYIENNLDFEWFNDDYISPTIKQKLNFIKDNFRPGANKYLIPNFYAVYFDSDNKFYNEYIGILPPVKIRILTIFRYWNIINYFNPHNYLLEKSWDDVLKEFLLPVINAKNVKEYHFALCGFLANIHDNHGFYGGTRYFYDNVFGPYIVPVILRYVENNYVVIDVLDSSQVLQKGDVLQTINNKTITAIEDSLKRTTFYSNEDWFRYVITSKLLRTRGEEIKLNILRNSQPMELTIKTNYSLRDYLSKVKCYDKNYYLNEPYKIITQESFNFLYVDLARVADSDLQEMFTRNSYADALILDCRKYPNNGCGELANYLIDANVQICKHVYPQAEYPGLMKELDIKSGFSRTPQWSKKVYILMNETSVSSMEYLITGYEQYPNATKIGNYTAGSPGYRVKLYLTGGINSGFTQSSIKDLDNRALQRTGIAPDILVKPTLKGILDGRDEVLDRAINHYITSVLGTSVKTDLPKEYNLTQNFPNPFNLTSTIEYSMPVNGRVELKVFDISGKEVATLKDGYKYAGTYKVNFNASGLASGVYLYRIKAGKYKQIKKMQFLK